MIQALGDLSASLAVSAVGSAIGCGIAGMAAVGAWKKAYAQNKAAPFILVAFVGAPLTQTIYGLILRNAIKGSAEALQGGFTAGIQGQYLGLGIVAGLAIAASAIFQGKAAACAADALGETGKGFGNYMMVLGIVETVALFTMVFAMTALP